MLYSRKLELVNAAQCANFGHCTRHQRACCTTQLAQFDVSGLPCPDMSKAGKRQRRAGPTSDVYLAHGRFTTIRRTPLLLIECTEVPWLLRLQGQLYLLLLQLKPIESRPNESWIHSIKFWQFNGVRKSVCKICVTIPEQPLRALIWEWSRTAIPITPSMTWTPNLPILDSTALREHANGWLAPTQT